MDSLVALHIARTFIDPHMRAMFVNTSTEWPEIVRFVRTFPDVDIMRPKMVFRQVCERKGFPLASKNVAYMVREARHLDHSTKTWQKRMGTDSLYSIPKRWRFLVEKPYETSELCCHYLKKEPARRYERERGVRPILGTMAGESALRTNTYIRNGGCNTFAEGKEQSMPLSIWTSEDVWEYIRHNSLPYCPIYDELECKRTGCVCCGFGARRGRTAYATLYRKYPKIYRFYMAVENNGVTYREALRDCGARLPDEGQQEIRF